MLNGNGQPPQPQTFDGNTPIPITLSLVAWNTMLTLIVEGPWKTADPLVKEIHRQIQIALENNPGAVVPSGPQRPSLVE